MGKQLYELRDMLMDELENISSKGELTAGSLETVDKLTHSIKSIDTICAMEEAGEYSHDAMSYADGRGRGSNADRDSRGRYSSETRGTSYARRGRYSRRGYSYDGKEDLIEELRGLMENADDNKSRQAIQHAIQQIEG